MDIKIVTGFPDKYLDESGAEKERLNYSFTVDGQPSMVWLPECNKPGLPKDYYIQRRINRLLAGRSAQAFGPAPTVEVGGKPVAMTRGEADAKLARVEAKLREKGLSEADVQEALDLIRPQINELLGRGEIITLPAESLPPLIKDGRSKPREGRPKYKFRLDGVESPETFETEAAARSACAMRAYMTRHKLRFIPDALARLQAEFPGRECRVWACTETHGIRATVDGEEYSIGWVRVGETWAVERFKKLESTDGVPSGV